MKVNGINFTCADFSKIDAALRLRIEACAENGEKQAASGWRKTLEKVREVQAQRSKKGGAK